MKLTSTQITNLLAQARIAITNTLKDPEIMAALAPYNYDKKRLEEGERIREKADELTSARKTKWTRYQTDGSRMKKYWKELKAVYNNDIRLARIAFAKDAGILDMLAARGTRKVAVADWLKDAMVFYTNALKSDEIIKGLSYFGLNRKKLKEHQVLIAGLEAKVAAQEERKGEARRATKERNQALDELIKWMRDYKTVVFIVFKGTQISERFGWTEKSEGYKPVGRPKKKKQTQQQENPANTPNLEQSPD